MNTSSGGGGPGPGGSGVGGAGQGGAGGQAGQGGQGGSTPLELMGDDGLVVRYFINAADDDGMGGLTLHDAPPFPAIPVDLPVTKDSGQPALVQDGGHWGLSWTASGNAGRPALPINGNRLFSDLDGTNGATIELVLKVSAVVGTADSRLLSIGTQSGVTVTDRFSLLATSTSAVEFRWDPNGQSAGTLAGAWQGLDLSARKVVHLVVDTTRAVSTRVRLFVNDQGVAVGAFTPPDQGKMLELTENADILALGNSPGGGVSFAGVLYYAALYKRPLTPAEITNNSMFLNAGDDGP